MSNPALNRFTFVAVAVAAACSPATTNTSSAPSTTSAPATGDFLAANLDTSVSPAVDFFQYANGGWLKKHPIPASEAAWGIGNEVREQLYVNLRKINEESAASSAAQGTDAQKIGDFWATAMDTVRLEQQGIHPLDAELARIDAIRTPNDAIDVAFAEGPLQIGPFFGFYIYQDEKKSDAMAVHVSQGGLGLPERDFYFNPDTGVARIRTEYVAHIARTLQLLGRDEASSTAAAQNVMTFETALAKASRKLEDLRDPVANYNKLKLSEAVAKYPNLKLHTFLKESGRPDLQEVVIRQTNFLAVLDKTLSERPLNDLKTYLHWHVLRAAAPYLHEAAEKENFKMYSTVLAGTAEQEPRWQRSGRVIDGQIGEALGKLFVDKHFPPEAKKRMNELVDNLRAVFKSRLEKVDWMTDATRQKALAKFERFTPKIGYPDKFRDYSTVKLRADDYLGNVHRASQFEQKRNWARIGKAVDRSEWGMTPPTVNAYFNPVFNEIVFPAGILQPPFFDQDADDSVNYGAIGFVIGHEITHGFDDQGRQYDADGNLKDWWAEADAREFDKRAERVVEQFNKYEPLPGMHINGKLTLGENIADLGGLSIAYEALERALAKDPSKRKMIDGFTPEQRFFLSAAQVWKWNAREAMLKQSLTTNPHSPAPYRVLGPLSNLPEFYEAFQVKTNAAMYRAPGDRAKIW